MKKEINLLRVALIVILVIAIGIGTIFCLGSGEANYDEITAIGISKNLPMNLLGGNNEYRLCFEDGEWVAYHNTGGVWSSDVKKIVVDESFANGIIDILKEYKMHRWNGMFGKTVEIMDKIEYDATAVTFSVIFANGDSIQVTPERIGKSSSAIYEIEYILGSLFEESEEQQ